ELGWCPKGSIAISQRGPHVTGIGSVNKNKVQLAVAVDVCERATGDRVCCYRDRSFRGEGSVHVADKHLVVPAQVVNHDEVIWPGRGQLADQNRVQFRVRHGCNWCQRGIERTPGSWQLDCNGNS